MYEHLHGRSFDHADGASDPEPERDVEGRDDPSEPGRDVGSREGLPVAEQEPEESDKPKPGGRETGKEFMARIKERDEMARASGRDDDRDYD